MLRISIQRSHTLRYVDRNRNVKYNIFHILWLSYGYAKLLLKTDSCWQLGTFYVHNIFISLLHFTI